MMIEQDPSDSVASPSIPARRLSRMLRWMLLVGVAVGLGAASAPVLMRTYLEQRLSNPREEARLDALNRLAAMVAEGRAPVDAFVLQLLSVHNRSSAQAAAGVDAIAVWLFQRSDEAVTACNQRLAGATDDTFRVAAGWLRHAGKWSAEHQPVELLLRQERIRLASDDAVVRVEALRSMMRMGRMAGPVMAESQTRLMSDASQSVRVAAVKAMVACRSDVDAVDALTAALADPAATVRRRAVELLGFMQSAGCLTDTALDLENEETDVVIEYLAALRGVGQARPVLLRYLDDADASLRAMAAWALGFDGGTSAGMDAALVRCLGDADEMVASCGAIALGRRAAVIGPTDAAASPGDMEMLARLQAMIDRDRWDTRAAALYALGRCGRALDSSDESAPAVRGALTDALRAGDVRVACAAVDALGELHDTAFLDVLLDIVDQWHDAPMLQLTAARAAMRIDADQSLPAMMDMCGSDSDEVRALSAYWTARLPDVPASQLFASLQDGGVPLRGGAALALALRGQRDWPDGRDLVEWLAARCQPGNADFEPSWRVRADYLSARLMLDDATARPDFDVYMLNANVGRIGPLLALLQIGDRSVLDRMIGVGSDIDLDSLCSDAQFAEVLHHYLPEAPMWFWFEGEALRLRQIERLKLWWGVFADRVRFDEQMRTFGVCDAFGGPDRGQGM